MSLLDNFTQIFSRWFTEAALPTIAKFNTETKNCPTTTEELIKLFQMPVTQVAPFPAMNQPTNPILPKPMTQSGTGGASGTGATRGRKKQNSGVTDTCRFVFTKGQSEGKTCGKTAPIYGYCRACVGKADAKEELLKRGITDEMVKQAKEAGTSGSDSGTGGTGAGTNGVAGLTMISPPSKPIFEPGVPNVESHVFREVDKNQHILVMERPSPGLMFHQPDGKAKVCIGIVRPGSNSPAALTPEEIVHVKSLGYEYYNATGNGATNGSNGVNNGGNGAHATSAPPPQVPIPAPMSAPMGFAPQLPPGMAAPSGIVPPPIFGAPIRPIAQINVGAMGETTL